MWQKRKWKLQKIFFYQNVEKNGHPFYFKNNFKKFLSALTEENLVISDEAINTLIRSYCRESGVRNLEKHLEKVIYFEI